MTSSDSKRLWRRAIKEHFNCTCVYCGENYELHELTLSIMSNLVAEVEKISQLMLSLLVGNVTKTKVVVIGSDGVARHLDIDQLENKL